MQVHTQLIESAPIDSASVVLLRQADAGAGFEVLLMRRHHNSAVLGGAYVFPGGKLDEGDCASDVLHSQGLNAAQCQALLGEAATAPERAAGLFMAAARELQEEAGVILPDLQRQLTPWSRWITPKMASVSSKRFDTRFFLAVMPEKQLAVHDNHETTDSCWLSPREALQQFWQLKIDLAPPQIMGLVHLARHPQIADVLQEAKTRGPVLVQPEPFDEAGTRTICYPGDARHSVKDRALPGPTRLSFKPPRFEPPGGLADLLGD
jgi:8-oxo-dGTP pyrophosphatase MutT (NUDIX family)